MPARSVAVPAMWSSVSARSWIAALAACVVAVTPGTALAGSGTTVQAMVVGKGGAILSGPRSVTAGPTALTVSGRHCAIAGGTPLAVLAGLRRLGGPAFSLRDYGRCGPAARNSGQLFVFSIGGEVNHGQSGWEYKAGGLSGTTGAADPSGIRGDGRLLGSGQRILWFWCEASGGGCQRTLEVSASSTVARSGTLAVRVMGYDNEGRGAPVAGAVVKLGTDFVTTGSSGRASLIVPSSPGHYALSATRPGLVPAFPETIVVR
jgi:hypothetical protein